MFYVSMHVVFQGAEAVCSKEVIFHPSGVSQVIYTEEEVAVPADNCVLEVG
jgi:hypothetical protein